MKKKSVLHTHNEVMVGYSNEEASLTLSYRRLEKELGSKFEVRSGNCLPGPNLLVLSSDEPHRTRW